MKNPSLSRLLVFVLIVFAICGWTLWATNRHHAAETALNARELEELNEYLLHDIGNFKKRYERVVRASAASGKGVSDVRLRQTLATLREENIALKNRLDEMSALHEKELKAALEAREATSAQSRTSPSKGAGPQPAAPAVDLGVLSLSPKAVQFQDSIGAKPQSGSAAPATVKAKILSTDEKDEFVIIDLGRKSGIDRGAEFVARRGSTTVAKLRVIEARDFLSACDVEYALPNTKLGANDDISLVRR